MEFRADPFVNANGAPVRNEDKFRRAIKVEVAEDGAGNETGELLSGGEGVGNMKMIAENLLDHFHCSVKIVAGRNTKLKTKLEKSKKGKYGDNERFMGLLKTSKI